MNLLKIVQWNVSNINSNIHKLENYPQTLVDKNEYEIKSNFHVIHFYMASITFFHCTALP